MGPIPIPDLLTWVLSPSCYPDAGTWPKSSPEGKNCSEFIFGRAVLLPPGSTASQLAECHHHAHKLRPPHIEMIGVILLPSHAKPHRQFVHFKNNTEEILGKSKSTNWDVTFASQETQQGGVRSAALCRPLAEKTEVHSAVPGCRAEDHPQKNNSEWQHIKAKCTEIFL